MKIFEHTIGRHRVRCPFEDKNTVQQLIEQFIPNVLFHVFKIKHFNPETTDLPTINGVGFKFGETLLTVFAEGTELLFVDKDGLQELAAQVPDKTEP